MRYTVDTGYHILVAHCCEDLEKQVNSMLSMLAAIDREAPKLRDGFVVDYGWVLLRLVGRDEGLTVCEPDFNSDADKFRPQVDTTLRVLAKQAAVIHAVGARPQAAKFDYEVRIEPGSLHCAQIGLVRLAPCHPRDTGWYIGRLDPGDLFFADAKSEAVLVYQLLRERPGLMKALLLPIGYRVAINGDDIIDVLDSTGQSVWPFVDKQQQ